MGLMEQARYMRNEKIFAWFNDILNNGGNSIQYAMVKGDVLSKLAYGKVNCRTYNDIDIIVPRNKLIEIDKVLTNCGYMQKEHTRKADILLLSASHQVLPYCCPRNHLTIDINFDVFWGEYEGKRIDIDEFLEDSIVIDIYGVNIRTLTILKSFIQLVLHHYKDMNSIFLLSTRKSIKYDMFKHNHLDFYRYVPEFLRIRNYYLWFKAELF